MSQSYPIVLLFPFTVYEWSNVSKLPHRSVVSQGLVWLGGHQTCPLLRLPSGSHRRPQSRSSGPVDNSSGMCWGVFPTVSAMAMFGMGGSLGSARLGVEVAPGRHPLGKIHNAGTVQGRGIKLGEGAVKGDIVNVSNIQFKKKHFKVNF